MFRPEESCAQCEKVTVMIESQAPIKDLHELPNTYDFCTQTYTWKYHEIMGYALIPCSFDGTRGQIDLYLCIDEDNLGDIDVYGYASRFFYEYILPDWDIYKSVEILQPNLSRSREIGCRKLHLNGSKNKK